MIGEPTWHSWWEPATLDALWCGAGARPVSVSFRTHQGLFITLSYSVAPAMHLHLSQQLPKAKGTRFFMSPG